MIKTNGKLFQILADHCTDHQVTLENQKSARYIASTDADKEWIKHLQLDNYLTFGRHRRISRARIHEEDLICLVGFEHLEEINGYSILEANGGAALVALTELDTKPNVPTWSIRDVYEAGHMDDGFGYSGHDFEQIGQLFPSVQFANAGSTLDENSTPQHFLNICAHECRHGDSWIDGHLASALSDLATADIPKLPYLDICSSIFDFDPRSLYLSLYRCLEANYAYEAGRRISHALQIDKDWTEMASILEKEISWRPPEETNLVSLLKYVEKDLLYELLQVLEPSINLGPDSTLAAVVGKKIYKIRNAIVHYRPGLHRVSANEYDWNKICVLLIEIVKEVFNEIDLSTLRGTLDTFTL